MSLTQLEADKIKRLALTWAVAERAAVVEKEDRLSLIKVAQSSQQDLDNYLEELVNAKPKQQAMDG